MQLVDVIELSKQLCTQPLKGKLAYATALNFVGRPLKGYHPDAVEICLMTPKAATALCDVQNALNKEHNLSLFIYDSYRPKRTVLDLIEWAKSVPADAFELERKKIHYPNISKAELFPKGYVSEDSNHCYGNTVDLVLFDHLNHSFLDMGAVFDFMDERSHLTATPDLIGKKAHQHRHILTQVMVRFGFEPYEKEFWHFCHGGRIGSETQFPIDIEITPDLKGIGVKEVLNSILSRQPDVGGMIS